MVIKDSKVETPPPILPKATVPPPQHEAVTAPKLHAEAPPPRQPGRYSIINIRNYTYVHIPLKCKIFMVVCTYNSCI